jgi:hypothetical protein
MNCSCFVLLSPPLNANSWAIYKTWLSLEMVAHSLLRPTEMAKRLALAFDKASENANATGFTPILKPPGDGIAIAKSITLDFAFMPCRQMLMAAIFLYISWPMEPIDPMY